MVKYRNKLKKKPNKQKKSYFLEYVISTALIESVLVSKSFLPAFMVGSFR